MTNEYLKTLARYPGIPAEWRKDPELCQPTTRTDPWITWIINNQLRERQRDE